ncbi:acyl-coenzyme A thioesterase 13-like [Vanessa tameamea]|uniref:Acyl-coenzyme A thioesterase 13-like n=1 Tax=Vanessa tameamea TaxID=334116 RepID=A0A8B8IUH5_VANTA|nr:acyl-coenzyme A thioesterase 13-like [Vanessa tameamea]XP_046977187.1 acyl-coenzyme A thioesterase 13-like [Vanessa cardui]XP_047543882.1 acyl-coenzyme A thioesterase 13-like [Vanessa atalanta]
MSNKAAKVAELFTKTIATTKCFDHNLRKVKVVCCDNGRLVTQFQVGPEHLNQRGTLHGGFIAHLVDAISTYALTANEKVDTRGVSIDLSVSYMNAAREGDNVEVEAVTRKLGKKVAFLEVEVRNKDNNQLLATGRHTKYVGI